MSKLSHPKLLLLWDAFQEKKHIKIVMEYISCGELFERISEDSYTLTEAKGITYMKQICTAIQYMHSLNILHLDLKAENILCVSVNSEDIKVIDFGLSQEFPVNNNKFVVPIAGTADFMSPEVIGNDPADLKTDCWSVGVLCYCILSGCLPFRGDDDNETIVNITRGDYDFDYEEFDSITDNAKDFICKLLQREKGNRMSMTDCLNHKWLTQSKASEVKLSNEKHKKLSSKWKKVHLMLRAAGRISQIRNMMSAARSLSDDEDVKIVTRAPSFECRMSDVEVDVGETATFKVQVTEGSCVQSFKWLREVSKTKRIELENNDKFKMSISANVATLQISKCLMSDNDGYMCQAMNSSGMVSCSADLYVNED